LVNAFAVLTMFVFTYLAAEGRGCGWLTTKRPRMRLTFVFGWPFVILPMLLIKVGLLALAVGVVSALAGFCRVKRIRAAFRDRNR
jgi:ABC-type antimicrobial peptide transport system permease subunit